MVPFQKIFVSNSSIFYAVLLKQLFKAMCLNNNQQNNILQVAATKEHQPAVGNWFNSLEKKLNVIYDFI